MKIAVLFPGIGYHCDKPLLYYSGKLAVQYQYELIKLHYTNLSQSIPEAFADACAQTEQYLENIDWNQYEEILFISKSIGTAVAAAYAQKHNIHCRNIYYTPLEQTFDFAPQFGLVFHGTCDSWAETVVIESKCEEPRLPLYIIEKTNHSLELQTEDISKPQCNQAGECPSHSPMHQASVSPLTYSIWTPMCIKSDIMTNIRILENVMELTEQYIAEGIYYRPLCADEICPELFGSFTRHQNVVKCWRKENEKWVIRDDPFIDDWSEDDYRFLTKCLKNTVQTGGLVYAAFCDHRSNHMLKGFVSVEPAIFGGDQGYLDLSSIHVSEDMRGKGIGKSLFRAAKDWAKKKGGRKLYISAHSAVETQAFYKAMGCVEAQVYDQRHTEQEPYDCQLECSLE